MNDSNNKTWYFVYVLKSLKDNKFYIGFTHNVKKRFDQHQNGEVFATKGRRPLELVFYEAFPTLEQAVQREHYLKTTKGKVALKRLLK